MSERASRPDAQERRPIVRDSQSGLQELVNRVYCTDTMTAVLVCPATETVTGMLSPLAAPDGTVPVT